MNLLPLITTLQHLYWRPSRNFHLLFSKFSVSLASHLAATPYRPGLLLRIEYSRTSFVGPGFANVCRIDPAWTGHLYIRQRLWSPSDSASDLGQHEGLRAMLSAVYVDIRVDSDGVVSGSLPLRG